jgi:FkbM family methyltransferase
VKSLTAGDNLAEYLAPPRGSDASAEELLQEVEEYFALGATIRPGNTVIDAGANVGAFALRAAKSCESDLSILCFEPSPRTFEALRETFRHNPVLRSTRHTLRQVGLTDGGDSGQERSFYNFRRFPTNSTLDLAAKQREFEIFFEDRGHRVREKLGSILGWPIAKLISWLPKGPLGRRISNLVMGLEEVRVKLESLDEVLAREKIATVDLLKIDVEGHELKVLRGLGPRSWPRIKQVVLETHDRDGRLKAIEKLLVQNGLTRIRIAAQKTIDNGLESLLLLARR